ncbi:MAG: hypothetical protein TR69_WS6001000752 [candidate division WS6 bacterium OLB20]|uniref:Uncharacterized protein n=1 Tax=candidate division WS6 bacterium OLB20 TaxID=1617426 RepID=A0A136LYR4_9BACT|nr:MAG: hypothetical protein TR69_WS6001000752 [candidate division WS6 bacterium OLB20]
MSIPQGSQFYAGWAIIGVEMEKKSFENWTPDQAAASLLAAFYAGKDAGLVVKKFEDNVLRNRSDLYREQLAERVMQVFDPYSIPVPPDADTDSARYRPKIDVLTGLLDSGLVQPQALTHMSIANLLLYDNLYIPDAGADRQRLDEPLNNALVELARRAADTDETTVSGFADAYDQERLLSHVLQKRLITDATERQRLDDAQERFTRRLKEIADEDELRLSGSKEDSGGDTSPEPPLRPMSQLRETFDLDDDDEGGMFPDLDIFDPDDYADEEDRNPRRRSVREIFAGPGGEGGEPDDSDSFAGERAVEDVQPELSTKQRFERFRQMAINALEMRADIADTGYRNELFLQTAEFLHDDEFGEEAHYLRNEIMRKEIIARGHLKLPVLDPGLAYDVDAAKVLQYAGELNRRISDTVVASWHRPYERVQNARIAGISWLERQAQRVVPGKFRDGFIRGIAKLMPEEYVPPDELTLRIDSLEDEIRKLADEAGLTGRDIRAVIVQALDPDFTSGPRDILSQQLLDTEEQRRLFGTDDEIPIFMERLTREGRMQADDVLRNQDYIVAMMDVRMHQIQADRLTVQTVEDLSQGVQHDLMTGNKRLDRQFAVRKFALTADEARRHEQNLPLIVIDTDEEREMLETVEALYAVRRLQRARRQYDGPREQLLQPEIQREIVVLQSFLVREGLDPAVLESFDTADDIRERWSVKMQNVELKGYRRPDSQPPVLEGEDLTYMRQALAVLREYEETTDAAFRRSSAEDVHTDRARTRRQIAERRRADRGAVSDDYREQQELAQLQISRDILRHQLEMNRDKLRYADDNAKMELYVQILTNVAEGDTFVPLDIQELTELVEYSRKYLPAPDGIAAFENLYEGIVDEDTFYQELLTNTKQLNYLTLASTPEQSAAVTINGEGRLLGALSQGRQALAYRLSNAIGDRDENERNYEALRRLEQRANLDIFTPALQGRLGSACGR